MPTENYELNGDVGRIFTWSNTNHDVREPSGLTAEEERAACDELHAACAKAHGEGE